MNIINIGIICDISTNTPIGVICTNKSSGDVVYLTKNVLLDESLELILDNDYELFIEEKIGQSNIIRRLILNEEEIMVAINYSLPFPWRILGVTSKKGNIEEVAQETFNNLLKGL